MFRVTRHGLREMLIGTIVLAIMALVLARWTWPWLGLLPIPIFIWLIAFFRDPERPMPQQQSAYVSPADGVVSDILELPECRILGEPALRVGIFLSVFNVHINRSPCDGRVARVEYKKGKFINAMHHHTASEENESNTLVLAEINGERPVAAVKQIVGLIARRIVCSSREGETVKRGDRIGMIKFGSRTELYIPLRLKPTVAVKVGQKVRGAADVIAVLESA